MVSVFFCFLLVVDNDACCTNILLPLLRRKKTTEEQYIPYLLKFIAWKHGGAEEYEKGAVFMQAQLLEITLRDLVCYMFLQASHMEDVQSQRTSLSIPDQEGWR
jgi:hypothetical protein